MKPIRPLLVLAVTFLLAALLAVPLLAQDARRPKKLIATGWDNADTARLLANLAVMEQRPFDGVVVEVNGQSDDKKPCDLRSTLSSHAWQRAWFDKPLQDLQACKFHRFTDNFLLVGANPGDVDWFDDAGWAAVVEHWRIAANLARQGRCKGLLFDPEPYTPPHSQFDYAAQAGKGKHSFAEYCDKTRQRGREVMQAVMREYPDLTLYCYFMNSVNVHVTGQADVRGLLESQGYGYALLPAFVDGWLDAAAPGVTLVDGCENAYRYNSPLEYLEAANAMRNACQDLVSPGNRAKYRAQVQVSFGLYLDAYVNPKTSPWYIDPQGSSRSERLKENIRTALRVADEYVWVYGEKNRWWPAPGGPADAKSWPDVLPGCDAILALARDAEGYARQRVAALGPATNLIRNGEFALDKVADDQGRTDTWTKGPPAGWGCWQHEASKGVFTWDRQAGCAAKGSAQAEGVANGCFVQSVPAKPGQTYAVAARTRTQGSGHTSIRVRWQTADGHWTSEGLDRTLSAKPMSPISTPAGEGWNEIFGVADVPPGAGRLVVLLGVGGQATPQDVAWFDDVKLFRID